MLKTNHNNETYNHKKDSKLKYTHLGPKGKPFRQKLKREGLCEDNTREKLCNQRPRAQTPQHSGLVHSYVAGFS